MYISQQDEESEKKNFNSMQQLSCGLQTKDTLTVPIYISQHSKYYAHHKTIVCLWSLRFSFWFQRAKHNSLTSSVTLLALLFRLCYASSEVIKSRKLNTNVECVCATVAGIPIHICTVHTINGCCDYIKILRCRYWTCI